MERVMRGVWGEKRGRKTSAFEMVSSPSSPPCPSVGGEAAGARKPRTNNRKEVTQAMEAILANIDLILTAAVIIITAIILARRGQIALLRQLLLSLQAVDGESLYQTLPTATRLLMSQQTVTDICSRCGKPGCTGSHPEN